MFEVIPNSAKLYFHVTFLDVIFVKKLEEEDGG